MPAAATSPLIPDALRPASSPTTPPSRIAAGPGGLPSPPTWTEGYIYVNDALAERLCIALEQLALELAQANQQGTVPAPVFRAVQQPATVLPYSPTPPTRSYIDGQGPFPSPQSSPEYQPIGWTCPVHGGMKVVPAGISKAGNPYTAFVACPERGCNEKPPRVPVPAPARAVPPSQLP